MKKLLQLLLIAGGIALISFRAKEDQNEGKLGDVVYSMLGEKEFQDRHGKGWVLMDGQHEVADKSAIALLQLQADANKGNKYYVPDARGVFIRGMNLGRDVLTGDPDGNRDAGKPQNDIFEKHNHIMGEFTKDNELPMRNGNGHLDQGFAIRFSSDGTSLGTMNIKRGGVETRPRNIVLYTYIKITE